MAYTTLKPSQIVVANGVIYRYLCERMFSDYDRFTDEVICVQNHAFGHITALIYRFLDWISMPLFRYEAKLLGLKEGEYLPVTTISYFIGKMFLLVNRFGTRIDRSFIIT